MDSDQEVLYDDDDSGTSENQLIEDDFPFEIEQCNSESEATAIEKYSFKVLSTEEIVEDMVNCIKEVNVIVPLSVTITRILLNHFNWDKDRLIEKYYDGDQDKLFKEAHIVTRLKKKLDTSNNDPTTYLNKDSSMHDCGVCYMSLPLFELTGLECGHRFCKECWNEYLTTKIMENGLVQRITCAAHGCDVLVDDINVINLLKIPGVRLRYQHLITNSFVECNKLLRWCPSPDCNNAIKVENVDSKPVTCKCNKIFCFACGGDWHDPINCDMLRKWLKKCKDSSETFNWIVARTKECPLCNTSIEKYGGCNQIHCQKCKHDFCWICMKPWEVHPTAWNRCNIYVNTDKAVLTKSQKEKHEADLNRYLFYSNRYMNHFKSLELENDLYISIQEKMEEMGHGMTGVEVQFLKVATDVLRECRRTLMYTYAFAFYLKKTNQTEIFEENQRDLEFATETLSGYLERDVVTKNLIDIKLKMQDIYKYCDDRRKALLGHVHEGYEKDTWEYLNL